MLHRSSALFAGLLALAALPSLAASGDRDDHAAQRNAARLSLTQLGIECDGKKDVSAAIASAMKAHPSVWLDGEGKTCGAASGILIPSNGWLRNLTIIDIKPGRANDRIFGTNGGVPVTNARLQNIAVNRNGTPDIGDMNGGAFDLANISNSSFDRIEIYGDGAGEGFFVTKGIGSCENNLFRNFFIHDMRWRRASDPGQEIMEGIRNSCSYSTWHNIRIHNLLGQIRTGPYRQANGVGLPAGVWIPYQVHCFVSSQASHDIVSNLSVDNCATGIDNSGSGGNSYLEYRNIRGANLGDWGFKLAHHSDNVRCTRCYFVNTGMSGFVIDAINGRNFTCDECSSTNPGAKYNWGTGSGHLWATNRTGVHIGGVASGIDQRNNLQFNNFTAIDNQSPHTMTFCIDRSSTFLDVQFRGLKCSGYIDGMAMNFDFPQPRSTAH